jgi:hypothetical protein
MYDCETTTSRAACPTVVGRRSVFLRIIRPSPFVAVARIAPKMARRLGA